jgi:aspartyl-tRNA(Asn)/glutamyl-tRNA(Gln) amidotransferase subunit B
MFRAGGISECEEGAMRCDVNLSVRPEGSTEYGVRTEMKNMSSFEAIERAIRYEAQRHIDALEFETEELVQETRRFDDATGTTSSLRSKENANDYRYFPEPDLPPIVIEETYLSLLKGSLPELPQAKRKRYIAQFGLTPYEATMLSNRKSLAEFFEKTLALCNDPKEVSNRLLGDGLKMLNETGLSIEDSFITPEKLALLIDKTNKKTLTRQQSKDIFELCFTKPVDIEQYILEKGLCPITNTDTISEAVKNTLLKHPDTVTEYLDGKTKVFGFLVGQTMRTLKGNADPALVNNILKEQLNLLQNNG